MTIRNLDFLFRPRSIAVVGASGNEESVGGAVMRNLLRDGFAGPVYPVHPTRRSVAGVHAYRDLGHLPQPADLAVLCTPPDQAADLVRSLGAYGTRAVAVLADQVAHEPILQAARRHLMRVLGPNSMGLIAPSLGLNASFAPTAAARGTLAFVSQSGALLAGALDWAASRDIGFSYVVSLGDAADVDAADVLDYLGSDQATRAVLMYLESVRAGRKFLSAARAAARAKPVIVMKAGRTAPGARAARAHTAGDPGDDEVFDAAVLRAGMLRVESIAALFEAAETLARELAVGERLSLLTNAGGPAVVALDALARTAGPDAVAGEPVDLGGDASATRYADALRAALEAAAHNLLVIHGPSSLVAPEAVAERCVTEARARGRGRVLACWLGGDRAQKGAAVLRSAGIPVYATPEAAVQAFVHASRYRQSQEALQESPGSSGIELGHDEAGARKLLSAALDARRLRLSDPEGKALLAAYGIPIVHTHVAKDADEAVRLAAEVGYPVALKVLSPDLEHRSEVGGVLLNLESESEVRAAARDIEQRMRKLRPDARLEGFTVQRMIRPPGAVHRRAGAHELRLSVAEDAIFGFVARMAGSVGLLPLNGALALDLLERSEVRTLLAGPGKAALARSLAQISQLVVHHAEIASLEIDPLLADDEGAMALEVRIGLAPARRASRTRFAISPYPRELEETVEVKAGSLRLRPIRPEDAPAYARLIEASDTADVQMRFFTLVRRLPARDLARFTQIDYDREMAFVATPAEDDGELLGEVRLYFYPDADSAEFAILVRTDRQRGGIGRALLEKAIAFCRGRGQKSLIGQIRVENEAMIALARRCGMEIEHPPGASLVVAHLDLQPALPQVRLF